MTPTAILAGPHRRALVDVGGALPFLVVEPLYVVRNVKLALVKCHTCKRWEDNPHVPTCHFFGCPMRSWTTDRRYTGQDGALVDHAESVTP